MKGTDYPLDVQIGQDIQDVRLESQDAQKLADIIPNLPINNVGTSMPGRDARNLLDQIQLALDRDIRGADLRRRATQMLVKLCCQWNMLPPSLFVRRARRIGSDPVSCGGFADIFKGTLGSRLVALKRIRIHATQTAEQKRKIHTSLCREAIPWRQLRHPNVLPFLGIDCETAAPHWICLVSPWVRYGDIMHYIETRQLVFDDVHRLMLEVASGLQYLHSQHLVHGDLRGANILIDENHHALLADFGLISWTMATGTAGTTDGHGAYRWMAPELLRPPRAGHPFQRTPASDMYAFACTFVEVCTRQPPYWHITHDVTVASLIINGERIARPSANFMWTGDDFSDELWHILESCLSEPPLRPSAADVVRFMQACSANTSVSAEVSVSGTTKDLRAQLELLRSYLAKHSDPAKLFLRSNASKQRLQNLSVKQFHDMTADICDELSRRKAYGNTEARSFLPSQKDFKRERNIARQNLASCPIDQFETLVCDIRHELLRRHPELQIALGTSHVLPHESENVRESPPLAIKRNTMHRHQPALETLPLLTRSSTVRGFGRDPEAAGHHPNSIDQSTRRRNSQPEPVSHSPSEYFPKQLLHFLPQIVYSRSNAGTPTPSEPGSDTERFDDITVSEADANRKINECIQLVFGLRNVRKAEVFFRRLPTIHHSRLVEQLVFRAIQSKQVDAQLVADIFSQLFRTKGCTPAAFEEGFRSIATMLDDIALDAPDAFHMMANMMKGSGMDAERCSRVAENSLDKNRLLRLLVESAPLPFKIVLMSHASDGDGL